MSSLKWPTSKSNCTERILVIIEEFMQYDLKRDCGAYYRSSLCIYSCNPVPFSVCSLVVSVLVYLHTKAPMLGISARTVSAGTL